VNGTINLANSSQATGILPIISGGTGATTAASARANLGVTATNISGTFSQLYANKTKVVGMIRKTLIAFYVRHLIYHNSYNFVFLFL